MTTKLDNEICRECGAALYKGTCPHCDPMIFGNGQKEEKEEV
jgi:hypothetical protein